MFPNQEPRILSTNLVQHIVIAKNQKYIGKEKLLLKKVSKDQIKKMIGAN